MAPFLKNYDGFDPETLAILTISLDATCEELQHNPCLDQKSARTAIADLIMKIASRGQSVPKRSRHWHWQLSGLIVTDRAKGEPPNRLQF